jgi:hypothetical protein
MGIMVRMPFTEVSAPEGSAAPRHRAARVRLAPEGRVSWGLAWKVCAFLPLALLCTAMVVQAAADRGDSGPREAARGNDSSVISSNTPGPTPILSTPSRSKKRHGAKSTESPSETPSSATSEPSTPSTNTPTRSPSPSPTSKPSPTPTPDEAREQCLEEGSTLAELAECIANKMGG